MGRVRQTKRVNVARVKSSSKRGRPRGSGQRGKERTREEEGGQGGSWARDAAWCRCQSNKTVQKSTRQREAATKTKLQREASRGEEEEGEERMIKGGETESQRATLLMVNNIIWTGMKNKRGKTGRATATESVRVLLPHTFPLFHSPLSLTH